MQTSKCWQCEVEFETDFGFSEHFCTEYCCRMWKLDQDEEKMRGEIQRGEHED